MPLESKQEALDALEKARAEYIEQARTAARQICSVGEEITIDDVREVAPPPEGVDPRIMGAILRAPDWRPVGYRASKRKTCHKRPVSVFKRVA